MKSSHYGDGSYGPVDIFRRSGLGGIKVNDKWGIDPLANSCSDGLNNEEIRKLIENRRLRKS